MEFLTQHHNKIISPFTIRSVEQAHTHMPCTKVSLLSVNPLGLRVLGRRGKKMSIHFLPPPKKSLQCTVTAPGMN